MDMLGDDESWRSWVRMRPFYESLAALAKSTQVEKYEMFSEYPTGGIILKV